MGIPTPTLGISPPAKPYGSRAAPVNHLGHSATDATHALNSFHFTSPLVAIVAVRLLRPDRRVLMVGVILGAGFISKVVYILRRISRIVFRRRTDPPRDHERFLYERFTRVRVNLEAAHTVLSR